jgi:hypothetical protein
LHYWFWFLAARNIMPRVRELAVQWAALQERFLTIQTGGAEVYGVLRSARLLEQH